MNHNSNSSSPNTLSSNRHSTSGVPSPNTTTATPNIQIENPNNRKRSDSQPVSSPQVVSNALLQQDIKRLTSSSHQLIIPNTNNNTNTNNNNSSNNNNNNNNNGSNHNNNNSGVVGGLFAHLIPPLFLPRSTSPNNPSNSSSSVSTSSSTSSLPSPSKFLRKRRQTLQRNNSNFINENLVDFYLKSGVGTSSYSGGGDPTTSPTSNIQSYNSTPTINDNYYSNYSQSPVSTTTINDQNHHNRHTIVDIIDIIYCDSSMNIQMPYSQYQNQLSSSKNNNNSKLNSTTPPTTGAGAISSSLAAGSSLQLSVNVSSSSYNNNSYNSYNSYANNNNNGLYYHDQEPLSPGVNTTTTPRKNSDEMAKGAHLIYLLRVRKGSNFSRSWCIEKRYSQFSKLHKSLVREHKTKLKNSEISKDLELPKLPPKLIIGNFKPENVQRRKESLQTYLDLICKGNSDLDSYLSNTVKESDFLSFDSVIEFLLLDLDLNSKIYQLPNDLFLRIFQYCIFEEIFPVLTLTCKWWYKIIYQSFKSLDMVYCNENVFFLKKSVAIDIIEDLTSLIIRFNTLVNLRLHSFYELDDSCLNLISKNCRFLENLEIVDCNLKTPTISLFRYRNVSLSDNTTVKVIDFSNNRNLTQIHFKNEMIEYGNMNNRNIYLTMGQNLCHLDLTNTAITDGTLGEMLSQLFGVLQTLNISQCKKLVKPQIEMKHLETLVMRYCSNVTHPIIKCSGLLYLDLSYSTSIRDEELWNGVLNQVTSLELLTLKLNSCDELRNVHLPIGTISTNTVTNTTTNANTTTNTNTSTNNIGSAVVGKSSGGGRRCLSPLSIDDNDTSNSSSCTLLSKLFRLELCACKNLESLTFDFGKSQLHYVDIRLTPISKENKTQIYNYVNSQLEELNQDKPHSFETRLISKAHEAYDIFQPQMDFASAFPNSGANSNNTLYFSSNHQNSQSSYHQNISRRTSNATPRFSNHSLYCFAILE